jgi:hypothetical protein
LRTERLRSRSSSSLKSRQFNTAPYDVDARTP